MEELIQAKVPSTLRELDSTVPVENILDILKEIKERVGPKVVDNAISKVMNTTNASNSVATTKVEETDKKPNNSKKRKREKQPFDINNYQHRFIAIKFLYIGEKYAGFARQDHMPETVERYVFDALIRTKLIADIDSCNYSRCGRTDRGVSAFSQVIALRVRSIMPIHAKLVDIESLDMVRPGQRFKITVPSKNVESSEMELKYVTEIDYPTQINRALPEDIRVYSVVPCAPTFSARFSCQSRTYKYYFLRKNLNIDVMKEAAKLFIGEHDFRNFCRLDLNVDRFIRHLKSFTIQKCDEQDAKDSKDQMYYFEIIGTAFLWHQVRCMVEILFLIGNGYEEMNIIPQLLDIEAHPRKPQYAMASELPLVLHDCQYKEDDLTYQYSPLALFQVYKGLYGQWEELSVKATMLKSHLLAINKFPVDPFLVIQEMDHYAPKLEKVMREKGLFKGSESSPKQQQEVLWEKIWPLFRGCNRKGGHIPLLERETGDSIEEKQAKKQSRTKS